MKLGTVKDIFMKLGTNIKQHRRRVENKNHTSCYVFMQNNAPLKLLISKSYPHYNFKTFIDIFMKLGINIKHWTIYREQEP